METIHLDFEERMLIIWHIGYQIFSKTIPDIRRFKKCKSKKMGRPFTDDTSVIFVL
jgi:hypothetical protein